MYCPSGKASFSFKLKVYTRPATQEKQFSLLPFWDLRLKGLNALSRLIYNILFWIFSLMDEIDFSVETMKVLKVFFILFYFIFLSHRSICWWGNLGKGVKSQSKGTDTQQRFVDISPSAQHSCLLSVLISAALPSSSVWAVLVFSSPHPAAAAILLISLQWSRKQNL